MKPQKNDNTTGQFPTLVPTKMEPSAPGEAPVFWRMPRLAKVITAASCVLASGLSLACSGVQRAEEAPAQVKKIIGEDTLVPVASDAMNIPENMRALVPAIGLLSTECTVFHVGNGLAITAGHCTGARRDRMTDQACADLSIKWGIIENGEPQATSKCTRILSAENSGELDFALLLVDPAPQASFKVRMQRSLPGEQATVLGYPLGKALHWSGICSIAEGGAARLFATQAFGHDCDTLVGVSGSPVIDPKTGAVFGIHNGGNPSLNYATELADTPLSDFQIQEESSNHEDGVRVLQPERTDSETNRGGTFP